MDLKSMNEKKRNIARDQGNAFTAAVEEMGKETSHGSVETEDYLVTVACEKAEGLYKFDAQKNLVWKVPDEGKNQHVEVVVQDREDGRFIPFLEVTCEITDDNGKNVGKQAQPFLWHPFLYHYGANWQIPGEGEYTVNVLIKAPEFPRHDEYAGKKYTKDVSVSVENLHLKPGRKEHGAE